MARDSWFASTFLILSLVVLAVSLVYRPTGALIALIVSVYFQGIGVVNSVLQIIRGNPVLTVVFLVIILSISYFNSDDLNYWVRKVWDRVGTPTGRLGSSILSALLTKYGYPIFRLSHRLDQIYGWLGSGWRTPAARLIDVAIGIFLIERLFALAIIDLPNAVSNSSASTNSSLYISKSVSLSSQLVNISPQANINRIIVNETLSLGAIHPNFPLNITTGGPLINGTMPYGGFFEGLIPGLLTTVGHDWEKILVVWFLIELIGFALNTTKKLVIDEVTAYDNEKQDKSSDQSDKESNPEEIPAKGLADLLIVNLNRLNELYGVVNEERATPSESGVGKPIEATMKTEDLSDILQSIPGGESDLALGPIKIPLGSFSSLMGRALRGPRIAVSLHKKTKEEMALSGPRDLVSLHEKEEDEKDVMTYLTASMTGVKAAKSWLVDSSKPLEETHGEESDDRPRSIEDMMKELAERIFVNLREDPDELVSWRASYKFGEGLRAYRDSLITSKNRFYNLKQAEKRFIQTLNESDNFALAYYNLGVVYTELHQPEAAESAFLKSIDKDPMIWEAYYALGLNLFSRAQSFEKILCRVYGLHNEIQNVEDENPPEQEFCRVKYPDISPSQSPVNQNVDDDNPCTRQFCTIETPDVSSDCVEAQGCIADLIKTHEEIAMLCQHVIYRNKINVSFFERNYAKLAKAWNLKGHALGRLWRLKEYQSEESNEDWKLSKVYFEKAVRYSWMNLANLELRGEATDDAKNIVGECIIDLADICLQKYKSNKEINEKGLAWSAEKVLKSAIKVDPAKANLHSELGEAYSCLGLFDEAAKEFRYAAGIDPESSLFWSRLALALACCDNKEDGALRACSKVIIYGKGASYEALKTAERTYIILKQKENATRYRRASLLAELEGCSGLGKRGICHLKKNLDKHGNEYDTWTYAQLVIAMCQLQAEIEAKDRTGDDLDIPLVTNRVSTCSSPENPEHYEDIAIYRLENEIDSCKNDRKMIQDLFALARLYVYAKDFEKARQPLQSIVDKIEECKGYTSYYKKFCKDCILEFSYILTEIGRLYLDSEDCKLSEHPAFEAEKCFRDAISLLEIDCPDEIKRLSLHALLARSLLKQNNQYNALKEAKEARFIKPINRDELNVIGETYCKLKEYGKACRAFEASRAFDVAPHEKDIEDPDILVSSGLVHLHRAMNNLGSNRKATLRKAQDYFDKAWKIYDRTNLEKRWYTRYYIGLVYMELCKYDEAIPHFMILYNLQTRDKKRLIAALDLGLAYLKLHAYEKCEMHYVDTINEWCSLIEIKDEDDRNKFLPPGNLGERPKTSIGNGCVKLLDRLNTGLNESVVISHGCSMPMGLIISYALMGLASSYAERDARLSEGLDLLDNAKLLANRLDKQQYTDRKIKFNAAWLDCRGWILYKQYLFCDEENQILCSIRFLEDSVSTEASSSAYLHLARAYELRLKRLDVSEDDLKDSLNHAQNSEAPNERSLDEEKIESRLEECPEQGQSPFESKKNKDLNSAACATYNFPNRSYPCQCIGYFSY